MLLSSTCALIQQNIIHNLLETKQGLIYALLCFSQEMSVYNLSVMLYPAECAEKPVNDLPLHLVFLCFHADDVLRILSAVLMEQRIVFVSSNYALLTIIMEVREKFTQIYKNYLLFFLSLFHLTF